MAVWAIGDVQGCHDELAQLIDKINFDPACDVLWFCGDLINRGGQSLQVLRLVQSLGDSAVTVLGNHDLSLLAIGQRSEAEQERVNPELREILFAHDRDTTLEWLRQRPVLHVDEALNATLVHAGLLPSWSIAHAQHVAGQIEQALRGKDHRGLLRALFGNRPDWNNRLRGVERLRAGINVFTRMRYCDVRGRIAFAAKGIPGTQPAGLYPWFAVPGQVQRETRIIFGHWSTLGLFAGVGVYGMDTGCVWGGALTAMRVDGEPEQPQYVAIKSTRSPPQLPQRKPQRARRGRGRVRRAEGQ